MPPTLTNAQKATLEILHQHDPKPVSCYQVAKARGVNPWWEAQGTLESLEGEGFAIQNPDHSWSLN